jgi:hypothetical protein
MLNGRLTGSVHGQGPLVDVANDFLVAGAKPQPLRARVAREPYGDDLSRSQTLISNDFDDICALVFR